MPTRDEARALASRAAKELFASLTAEEKATHVANLRAARLAAIARKRAAGTWADPLGSERRRELGKLGGQASARVRGVDPKYAGLNEAQLKAARAVFSIKRRVLRPAAGRELQLGEQGQVRDRLVTLPRTSRCADPGAFLKMLHHVEPDDAGKGGGFGFEGVFMRPGAIVHESQLWPDRSFPAQPLVLESAGRLKETGECLFILWRLEGRQWQEVGRMASKKGEWSSLLRPLAVLELSRQGLPKKPKGVNLAALCDRATTWLERETAAMSPEDRNAFWAMHHDVCAGRIAAGLPKSPKAQFQVIDVPAIAEEEKK